MIIVLLPIFYMFGSSTIVAGTLSLESYREIFTGPRQLGLLVNSLILACGTTCLTLLFGVPLAFLIARTDLYLKKYFKWLYLIPILIPSYVSAIAWIYLLGKKGSLNLFLMRLFSLKEPLFTIYGMPGSLAVLALSYFPFVTLLTISGLNSIDQRHEEAARLSHNELGVLRGVTLPLVMPHILSAAIFVFIFSISNYGVPSLLRLTVYPVEIFVQFSTLYNPRVATAMSLPLVLITLILILLQRHYMGTRSYVTLESGAREARLIRLGRWRVPALIFSSGVILLSVVLPIGILLIKSGSLMSYKIALRTAYREILSSLTLALVAATIILMLSFFISYIIERTRQRGRGAMDVVSLLPFAIPGVILGIGLIKVWNRPILEVIYGSSLIIILGYIARFSPFTIRVISSNFKQINRNLEEAAMLSDVNWLRRVTKILVPLARPGLLAGWIIAFILCLGELGTTLLVIPPGKATLTIRIYNIMHYGAYKLVAALSVILIAVTLVPIVILTLWRGRRSLLMRREI